ncbi:MAG: hypothetical protein OEV73_12250 [Desulfobulbaceae bacterium]|nr:hypothetical protein [Desulfobulbaceae bacterium]
MRSAVPARLVFVSVLVGFGLVAVRALRLVGVGLALAGGRGRRNPVNVDAAEKVEK